MTDWERAICARVKLYREKIKWSQREFAAQIGVSLNQLASIEYGRTPLRYSVAWRMRLAFGVSLSWLDEGFTFPDDSRSDEKFPPPERTGLPARALLSAVAKSLHDRRDCPSSDRIEPSETHEQFAEHLFDNLSDIQLREVSRLYLTGRINEWLAAAPPGRVEELATAVVKAAKSLLNTFPPQAQAEIEQREDELMWIRIRSSVTSKFADAESKGLTHLTLKSNSSPVRSELKILIKRLQQATAAPGTKVRLARLLGVPASRVSEWLSGKKEPGGETTLRLLRWVEAQEQLIQQETPGSVTTTSKGESALRTGHINETNQSKSRKR